MSRVTDLIAIGYVTVGHCTDPTCQKCSAQFRWLRRKGWRTRKTSAPKNTERK
jgi:hypothetical protein